MSRQGFGRSLTLITLTQACSISLCCFGPLTPARGQISSDRTLGTESSVIVPNVNIRGIPSDQIDGGAIRGTSLFHSFSEFNIREGRGAYFTNPTGIENILSRVTGTNPSNILGRLGVLGNANLFLINPNGIVFGPNAKLDVGGSFVASTASALKLADGTFFSATDPSAPPLLTISIPVGLQYRGIEGSIQVKGSRFSVPNGETLALVGGAVSLDGAALLAAGGRIELGGLAGVETVGLNVDGNNPRLSFSDGIALSDVSLTRAAGVTVAAGGGGSIAVNARNLDISGGSILNAGIRQGLGAVDAQAGNITVNATGEIKVVGGGILAVEANSILLEQGKLTAESITGKGGDIQLRVGDLLLLRRNSLISAVSGTVGSTGRDGNINIDTKFLVAIPSENSDIIATGFGRSVGSNIQVNAKGIFGTQFREQLTPRSDIVATGTVNLNTPGVDPSQGLIALPETVVDPAALIAQNPCERGKGSEFTVTGRGGLPPNPSDALSSDSTHVGLVEPASSPSNLSTATRKQPPTHPTTEPIVPAQSWVFNDKGQVVLTASNPISMETQRPWTNPAPCKNP